MAAVARGRRGVARLAFAIAIAASAAVLAAQAQRRPEYQVKAAYLYGFGKFVEWPAGALPSGGLAFVVCVLGDDPFGRELDEVTAGAVMKGKPVSIRRISRVDESGACHTLFISASEDVRIGAILETVGERPILTVSDAPQFAERGGMIGFALDGNRVRFTLNLPAAQDAGLVLNSELLRVAAAILRARPPKG
jgi:hypothetical protein